MKKLFISVPMRDRTEENIKKSMEKMHKIAEAVFGEELEVIPSYIEHRPPENVHQAVWYLGESIKKLSEADYFIGIEWCSGAAGCDVERIIAGNYLDHKNCYLLPQANVIPPEEYKEMNEVISVGE